ncbi:hypothetical protein [Acinetobacter pragensis]|nr:hypothetical protein [Acinetobacter pragensis]
MQSADAMTAVEILLQDHPSEALDISIYRANGSLAQKPIRPVDFLHSLHS